MSAALKIQELNFDEIDALEASFNETVREVVVEDVAAGSIDELDAMFEELELGFDSSAQATAEIAVDLDSVSEEELVEAGLAASIEEAKAQAYAEMNETFDDDDSVAAEPMKVSDEEKVQIVKSAKASAGGKVAKAPKAPKAPRAPVGASKSDALKVLLAAELGDYMCLNIGNTTAPKAQVDAFVEAKLTEIDTLPVKIQEKITNLFGALAKGTQLSNYTKIAIGILKEGELTSKALREAYIARPYSVGTANSQCTQLMKLIQVLELANKDGDKLVMNTDSLLMPMLIAITA